MKKSLMVLLCLSVPFFLIAQGVEKQKEIGLVFSNLDNFGLTFKTGTENSLWRFNTLFISGSTTEEKMDSSLQKSSSDGFGIKFGREYRKSIVDNLELRFGADVSFTYAKSKSNFDDQSVNDSDNKYEKTTYKPGVNLVFGLNYVVKENLVIGAELLPNFSYTIGTEVDKNYYTNNEEEVNSDISGFNYGLSNTSVLLSLAYRF
jgi:hypothetical protein